MGNIQLSQLNKETIRKCPSGALSYSIDGVEYKDRTDRDQMTIISKNDVLEKVKR